VLAGEHLGAKLPSFMNFLEYWEKLDPANLAERVTLTAKQASADLL
jgi:hypothetical protein